MAYLTDEELIAKYSMNKYTKICRKCNQIFHEKTEKCSDCGNELDNMTEEECATYIKKTIMLRRKWDKEREQKRLLEEQRKIAKQNGYSQQYVPKCPVCQSPNIKKISAAKRAVHGYAFGLFSNTARSQWECLNCGHKF